MKSGIRVDYKRQHYPIQVGQRSCMFKGHVRHAVRQSGYPMLYTNPDPQKAWLEIPQLRREDRNMNRRRYKLVASGLLTENGEFRKEGLGIDNASKAVV